MCDWSAEELDTIWSNGKTVPHSDPDDWRADHRGRIMHFDEYCDEHFPYAWTVDWIVPKDQGGLNESENLRPVHIMTKIELDMEHKR